MICRDEKYFNIDNHMNEVLRKNIYDKRKNIINSCPHCKSKRYIKYGKFKGTQRFKCKNCGKTFSLVTNTTWSYSKKNPSKWLKFIELFLEKKVLQECAEILDININTAFSWRHKVLKKLSSIEKSIIMEGAVHMTRMSVKENFKGSRNIKTDERANVTVISAKGDRDTMMSVPLCKNIWSWRKFEERVGSRISKTSFIVPYVDRYIFIAAKRYGQKNKEKVVKNNELIKSFRTVYKSWIKVFKGVATKYLGEYLSWLVIFFMEKKFNDVDVFYELNEN